MSDYRRRLMIAENRTPIITEKYSISMNKTGSDTYTINGANAFSISVTPLYTYKSTSVSEFTSGITNNDSTYIEYKGVSAHTEAIINGVTTINLTDSGSLKDDTITYTINHMKINKGDNITIKSYVTDKDGYFVDSNGNRVSSGSSVYCEYTLNIMNDSYSISIYPESTTEITMDESKSYEVIVKPRYTSAIDGLTYGMSGNNRVNTYTLYDGVSAATTVSTDSGLISGTVVGDDIHYKVSYLNYTYGDSIKFDTEVTDYKGKRKKKTDSTIIKIHVPVVKDSFGIKMNPHGKETSLKTLNYADSLTVTVTPTYYYTADTVTSTNYISNNNKIRTEYNYRGVNCKTTLVIDGVTYTDIQGTGGDVISYNLNDYSYSKGDSISFSTIATDYNGSEQYSATDSYSFILMSDSYNLDVAYNGSYLVKKSEVPNITVNVTPSYFYARDGKTYYLNSTPYSNGDYDGVELKASASVDGTVHNFSIPKSSPTVALDFSELRGYDFNSTIVLSITMTDSNSNVKDSREMTFTVQPPLDNYRIDNITADETLSTYEDIIAASVSAEPIYVYNNQDYKMSNNSNPGGLTDYKGVKAKAVLKVYNTSGNATKTVDISNDTSSGDIVKYNIFDYVTFGTYSCDVNYGYSVKLTIYPTNGDGTQSYTDKGKTYTLTVGKPTVSDSYRLEVSDEYTESSPKKLTVAEFENFVWSTTPYYTYTYNGIKLADQLNTLDDKNRKKYYNYVGIDYVMGRWHMINSEAYLDDYPAGVSNNSKDSFDFKWPSSKKPLLKVGCKGWFAAYVVNGNGAQVQGIDKRMYFEVIPEPIASEKYEVDIAPNSTGISVNNYDDVIAISVAATPKYYYNGGTKPYYISDNNTNVGSLREYNGVNVIANAKIYETATKKLIFTKNNLSGAINKDTVTFNIFKDGNVKFGPDWQNAWFGTEIVIDFIPTNHDKTTEHSSVKKTYTVTVTIPEKTNSWGYEIVQVPGQKVKESEKGNLKFIDYNVTVNDLKNSEILVKHNYTYNGVTYYQDSNVINHNTKYAYMGCDDGCDWQRTVPGGISSLSTFSPINDDSHEQISIYKFPEDEIDYNFSVGSEIIMSINTYNEYTSKGTGESTYRKSAEVTTMLYFNLLPSNITEKYDYTVVKNLPSKVDYSNRGTLSYKITPSYYFNNNYQSGTYYYGNNDTNKGIKDYGGIDCYAVVTIDGVSQGKVSSTYAKFIGNDFNVNLSSYKNKLNLKSNLTLNVYITDMYKGKNTKKTITVSTTVNDITHSFSLDASLKGFNKTALEYSKNDLSFLYWSATPTYYYNGQPYGISENEKNKDLPFYIGVTNHTEINGNPVTGTLSRDTNTYKLNSYSKGPVKISTEVYNMNGISLAGSGVTIPSKEYTIHTHDYTLAESNYPGIADNTLYYITTLTSTAEGDKRLIYAAPRYIRDSEVQYGVGSNSRVPVDGGVSFYGVKGYCTLNDIKVKEGGIKGNTYTYDVLSYPQVVQKIKDECELRYNFIAQPKQYDSTRDVCGYNTTWGGKCYVAWDEYWLSTSFQEPAHKLDLNKTYTINELKSFLNFEAWIMPRYIYHYGSSSGQQTNAGYIYENESKCQNTSYPGYKGVIIDLTFNGERIKQYKDVKLDNSTHLPSENISDKVGEIYKLSEQYDFSKLNSQSTVVLTIKTLMYGGSETSLGRTDSYTIKIKPNPVNPPSHRYTLTTTVDDASGTYTLDEFKNSFNSVSATPVYYYDKESAGNEKAYYIGDSGTSLVGFTDVDVVAYIDGTVVEKSGDGYENGKITNRVYDFGSLTNIESYVNRTFNILFKVVKGDGNEPSPSVTKTCRVTLNPNPVIPTPPKHSYRFDDLTTSLSGTYTVSDFKRKFTDIVATPVYTYNPHPYTNPHDYYIGENNNVNVLEEYKGVDVKAYMGTSIVSSTGNTTSYINGVSKITGRKYDFSSIDGFSSYIGTTFKIQFKTVTSSGTYPSEGKTKEYSITLNPDPKPITHSYSITTTMPDVSSTRYTASEFRTVFDSISATPVYHYDGGDYYIGDNTNSYKEYKGVNVFTYVNDSNIPYAESGIGKYNGKEVNKYYNFGNIPNLESYVNSSISIRFQVTNKQGTVTSECVSKEYKIYLRQVGEYYTVSITPSKSPTNLEYNSSEISGLKLTVSPSYNYNGKTYYISDNTSKLSNGSYPDYRGLSAITSFNGTDISYSDGGTMDKIVYNVSGSREPKNGTPSLFIARATGAKKMGNGQISPVELPEKLKAKDKINISTWGWDLGFSHDGIVNKETYYINGSILNKQVWVAPYFVYCGKSYDMTSNNLSLPNGDTNYGCDCVVKVNNHVKPLSVHTNGINYCFTLRDYESELKRDCKFECELEVIPKRGAKTGNEVCGETKIERFGCYLYYDYYAIGGTSFTEEARNPALHPSYTVDKLKTAFNMGAWVTNPTYNYQGCNSGGRIDCSGSRICDNDERISLYEGYKGLNIEVTIDGNKIGPIMNVNTAGGSTDLSDTSNKKGEIFNVWDSYLSSHIDEITNKGGFNLRVRAVDANGIYHGDLVENPGDAELSLDYVVTKPEPPKVSIVEYNFYADNYEQLYTAERGESHTFNITSNKSDGSSMDFSISSKPYWINATKSGNAIEVTCSNNSSYSTRDEYLVLKQDESNYMLKILIRQIEGHTHSFIGDNQVIMKFNDDSGIKAYLHLCFPYDTGNDNFIHVGQGGWETDGNGQDSCFAYVTNEESSDGNYFSPFYFNMAQMRAYAESKTDGLVERLMFDIIGAYYYSTEPEGSSVNLTMSMSNGTNSDSHSFTMYNTGNSDEGWEKVQKSFSYMGYVIYHTKYNILTFYLYNNDEKMTYSETRMDNGVESSGTYDIPNIDETTTTTLVGSSADQSGDRTKEVSFKITFNDSKLNMWENNRFGVYHDGGNVNGYNPYTVKEDSSNGKDSVAFVYRHGLNSFTLQVMFKNHSQSEYKPGEYGTGNCWTIYIPTFLDGLYVGTTYTDLDVQLVNKSVPYGHMQIRDIDSYDYYFIYHTLTYNSAKFIGDTEETIDYVGSTDDNGNPNEDIGKSNPFDYATFVTYGNSSSNSYGSDLTKYYGSCLNPNEQVKSIGLYSDPDNSYQEEIVIEGGTIEMTQPSEIYPLVGLGVGRTKALFGASEVINDTISLSSENQEYSKTYTVDDLYDIDYSHNDDIKFTVSFNLSSSGNVEVVGGFHNNHTISIKALRTSAISTTSLGSITITNGKGTITINLSAN